MLESRKEKELISQGAMLRKKFSEVLHSLPQELLGIRGFESIKDKVIQVEICGPAIKGRSRPLGWLEVQPKNDKSFNLNYQGDDGTKWGFHLDPEGNLSETVGITNEEVMWVMDKLIEPENKSQPYDSHFRFRLPAVGVSRGKGTFHLPEGHGFMGTLLNQDIHVGSIALRGQRSPTPQLPQELEP